jgi:hypothetical protein
MEIVHKAESYAIMGACFEVYRAQAGMRASGSSGDAQLVRLRPSALGFISVSSVATFLSWMNHMQSSVLYVFFHRICFLNRRVRRGLGAAFGRNQTKTCYENGVVFQ